MSDADTFSPPWRRGLALGAKGAHLGDCLGLSKADEFSLQVCEVVERDSGM